MSDKNQKSERETGAALALAAVLQNVLILVVIVVSLWALQYLTIEQSGSFNMMMRGGFLQ